MDRNKSKRTFRGSCSDTELNRQISLGGPRCLRTIILEAHSKSLVEYMGFVLPHASQKWTSMKETIVI